MAGVLARMPSYFAWRSSSTRLCCWASSRARSTADVAGGRPASNGLARRRRAMCAARIMILDGTHEVRRKLADLRAIESRLRELVDRCGQARGQVNCPLIDAIEAGSRG